MDKTLKTLLYASALVGAAGAIQSFIIEPNSLMVKHVQIIKNRQATKPLHFVHFSDLHLGKMFGLKKLKKFVNVVNSQNPDLVFFTGDLTEHLDKYQHRYEAATILSGIHAKYGKYAVFGNHDKMGNGLFAYAQDMENAGFILLKNSDEIIDVGNNKQVHLFGWDEAQFGAPDPSILLKATIQPNVYNILLLHQPDLLEWVVDSHIHLALAGHSHGGQVRLPLVGPVVTSNYSDIFHTHMYKIGKTYGYVNTGVGESKMAIRFLNMPSITVFDIYY